MPQSILDEYKKDALSMMDRIKKQAAAAINMAIWLEGIQSEVPVGTRVPDGAGD